MLLSFFKVLLLLRFVFFRSSLSPPPPYVSNAMSGMYELIFYMFVVAPGARWFIEKKGVVSAVGFLSVLSLVQVYFQHIHFAEPNFYRTLNVYRDATGSQVKRAYRQVSLQYHPDKLVGATPEEQQFGKIMMEKVHIAYEVLKDGRKKMIYDRHGISGLEGFESSPGDRDHENSALMGMGIHYMMTAVMTFLMTLGSGSNSARTYCYTALIIMFLIEWQCKFDDFDFFVAALPYDSPYDKIQILHLLYPAFMVGARLIAEMTFVDREGLLMAHVVNLRRENVAIMERLNFITAAIQKRGGAKGISAAADDAKASPNKLPDTPAVSELRNRAKRADAPPGARVMSKEDEKIAAAQKKAASAWPSIPSPVMYLGFYFLINYILK